MKLKFNPNLDFQREAIDSIVGGRGKSGEIILIF